MSNMNYLSTDQFKGIPVEEIKGVLAEDDQGPYWLTIRDVYRTEDGLVILVDPKKKPVHMALLENDDD